MLTRAQGLLGWNLGLSHLFHHLMAAEDTCLGRDKCCPCIYCLAQPSHEAYP